MKVGIMPRNDSSLKQLGGHFTFQFQQSSYCIDVGTSDERTIQNEETVLNVLIVGCLVGTGIGRFVVVWIDVAGAGQIQLQCVFNALHYVLYVAEKQMSLVIRRIGGSDHLKNG